MTPSLNLYEITTRAFYCPLWITFVGQNDMNCSVGIFWVTMVSFPCRKIHVHFKTCENPKFARNTMNKNKAPKFLYKLAPVLLLFILIMAVISCWFHYKVCFIQFSIEKILPHDAHLNSAKCSPQPNSPNLVSLGFGNLQSGDWL